MKSRTRPGTFFGIAALLLGLAAVTGISVGSTVVHWSVIPQVLLARPWPFDSAITVTDEFIVWSVRVPRLLVGVFSGAALSVAGASLQGLFRNPVAGPGIIGASSGAACGAALALVAGLAVQSALWLPLTAFAGAFLAVFLVYAIATRGGRTPVTTLILSGIACGAFFNAIVQLLISLRFADWQVAAQVLYWIMGGLDSRTWTHVWIALPFAITGTAMIVLCSRSLDLTHMGEESAQSLGAEVESTKRSVLIGASLRIASSVAVSGVLAIVGLVAPTSSGSSWGRPTSTCCRAPLSSARRSW